LGGPKSLPANEVVEEAPKMALTILEKDPKLTWEEHKNLRESLMAKKFVLEEYSRFTDQDLIDDLLRVASELNKKSLSHFEYRDRGKYKAHNFVQRFGSWIKALEKAGLGKNRSNVQRVTNQYLIDD